MSRCGARRLLALPAGGIALGLSLLLGCGRQGPPVPPRAASPTAVQALRADLEEGAIIVSWVRPAGNSDGSPLTDLGEFRLSRAVQTPADREAGRQPPLSPLAVVLAEEPTNAAVLMDRYAYQDPRAGDAFPVGSRVSYRVEPVNRRGRVGPAAMVAVDLGPAPGPPTGVSARPGDGIVDLTWSAPTGVPPARGYNVYRGSEPGVHGAAPLNTTPLLEQRFQDSTVTNGATYYYVVRSVGGDEPPFREGKSSAEVVITPEDRTAPASPSGLAAVPFAGGVALVWNPNTEADLQGYLVYRREPESVTPTRLTPSPIPATMFTDRSTRPGATYLYSVTAVDRSPRHNESVPSAEVEANLP
jgi:hypothetical protein